MSDAIKHECGIAVVRLLKPLDYYAQKYGNPLYGFNKLFLLMEKQHNRGQDGAGIGAVKLNMPPGHAYMFRERDVRPNALTYIFSKQLKEYNKLVRDGVIHPEFPSTVKEHFEFGAEVLMGHLRYGTSGNYIRGNCHPYYRRSTWPTRNLMVAGNFNMTNLEALNERLIDRGSHPIFNTDTQTILEEVGFHLDEEHDRIYREMRDSGVPGREIPDIISKDLDPGYILRQAAAPWDGGYTIGGLIGNGDAFVVRDPWGIRPGYFYRDDEVVAVASERVALMTIFDAEENQVQAIQPGHAIVIKNDGRFYESEVVKPKAKTRGCSFERIYFSRGNDSAIYQERKALGGALADQILEAINNDLKNSVFSFVPNTAETAYYGLMDELRLRRRQEVKDVLLAAAREGRLDETLIDDVILNNWPRGEKIAHKDIKLRTFISQEKNRVQLASHVYDITYGIVQPTDHLVCVDDSIVRGTTLRQSILRILSRANPKQIIIASTAPQIRYPDCYGIDMSEMGKFIAFQAAMALCKDLGCESIVREVYEDCAHQADRPADQMVNHVKRIYETFTSEQISVKIAELVKPKNGSWHGDITIIYQKIENLHRAIPENNGDWYFTGEYPTPGGYAVLNRAFMNYYEKRDGRSY